MSLKKVLSASVVVAALNGTAIAQNTPAQVQPATNTQIQNTQPQGVHAMLSPQQIATCLALANREEVILTKFAQDKIKDPQISNYAKKVINDHQECLKQLSKWVPNATQEEFLTEGQHDQVGTVAAPNGSRPNNQTTSTISTQAPAGVDIVQLDREMAQQCIADSKQALSKKDGEKLEACFVGMQIAKHAAMRTKLTVLQRHTSGELQQVIAKGLEMTNEHLKEAEKLMEDIDSDNHKSLARDNR